MSRMSRSLLEAMDRFALDNLGSAKAREAQKEAERAVKSAGKASAFAAAASRS
jgi:hypothetical protein